MQVLPELVTATDCTTACHVPVSRLSVCTFPQQRLLDTACWVGCLLLPCYLSGQRAAQWEWAQVSFWLIIHLFWRSTWMASHKFQILIRLLIYETGADKDIEILRLDADKLMSSTFSMSDAWDSISSGPCPTFVGDHFTISSLLISGGQVADETLGIDPAWQPQQQGLNFYASLLNSQILLKNWTTMLLQSKQRWHTYIQTYVLHIGCLMFPHNFCLLSAD